MWYLVLFVVLIVAFILFKALPLLTPILLALIWIFSNLKIKKALPKLKGSLNDFWLTKDEKLNYIDELDRLQRLKSILSIAKQRAPSLPKNVDGSISRRSNVGKNTRETIENYPNLIESSKCKITLLENLPLNRWRSLNKLFSSRSASKTAIIVWMCVLLIFFFYHDYQNIEAIALPFVDSFLNTFSNEKRFSLSSAEIDALYSTGITWITYFVSKFFSNGAEMYTPKPGKINLDNINDFEG